MSKTREQIEKELDSNIPRDAVSSRSAGGGKALSYLETWYVIDRLNKVFGNLGWDAETVDMVLVSEPGQPAAYRSKVRITVACEARNEDGSLAGFRTVIREGTGWGSDKSKLNPHEMASKEAESDALKRAAMKLGISMGLGLYDKSGEFVDEAPKPVTVAQAVSKAVTQTAAIVKEGTDREALNKRISAISKVVIAKKLKTLEELKADMKTKYGADQTAGLDDVEAKELLANLEKLANGQ